MDASPLKPSEVSLDANSPIRKPRTPRVKKIAGAGDFIVYVVREVATGLFLNLAKRVESPSQAKIYNRIASARITVTKLAIQDVEAEILRLRAGVNDFAVLKEETARVKQAMERRAKLKEAKVRRGSKEFPGLNIKGWPEFLAKNNELSKKKAEAGLSEEEAKFHEEAKLHIRQELDRAFPFGIDP